MASKVYEKQLSPLLKEIFEGQNKKAFFREHAIAAFQKSGICSLNKEVIPKDKILQGREMDEPVAKISIGYSYEAPRTRRRATIETSIKKSWNPSHIKVPFRHFATEHEEFQKRKGEIFTEPEAVKRLKSKMMTRERRRLQRRPDLLPSLGRETPSGKRLNAANAD